MKINLHVNTIIFDMDGVITNTMPYHFKAWKDALLKHDVRVSYEDIYAREGQPGKQSVKELFQKYNKKYTNEVAKELLLSKEELFKKIVKNKFITGSRSFLKQLHNQNFTLGLVTGTARHELHKMLPDSLYNLFSVSITGCEVKNGKPHPEPFLRALKKLDADPAKSVVIENAPFGIKSAKSAGIKTLAIATSLPISYLNEADHAFENLKELQHKVNFNYENK